MAALAPAAQILEDPITIARRGFEALLSRVPVDDEVRRNTPDRMLRAFDEMTQGYYQNAAEILKTRFPVTNDDLVILKDVEFTSLCEHHLMPFTGYVHLGYIPAGSVVGVSKLARLVDMFARRLQLQERFCNEIAWALQDHLSPDGAAVIVEATHGCLCHRGARKQRANFISSAMLGRFRDKPALRQEFCSAIHLSKSNL